MASAKKKVKKSKFKLSRRSIIFASIAGVLLLVVGGFWLRSYLIERQNLSELSMVGDNLESVYNNLITKYGDIVRSSSFGYECYESSVEVGRGTITCGPAATIEFKQEQDLDQVRSSLYDTIDSSKTFENVSRGVTTNLGLSLSFSHGATSCSASGSSIKLSLYCLRTVPYFLPGYIIEK